MPSRSMQVADCTATQWIAQTLAQTTGLSLDQQFIKRECNDEDVLLLIKTVWTYPIDVSTSPRTRVTFHALLIILSLGGFRPGCLMGIPYQNITIAAAARVAAGSIGHLELFIKRRQGNARPLNLALISFSRASRPNWDFLTASDCCVFQSWLESPSLRTSNVPGPRKTFRNVRATAAGLQELWPGSLAPAGRSPESAGSMVAPSMSPGSIGQPLRD